MSKKKRKSRSKKGHVRPKGRSVPTKKERALKRENLRLQAKIERYEKIIFRRNVAEWAEKIRDIEDDETRAEYIEFIRDNEFIELDDWVEILMEDLDMSEHDAYELWYYP